jgi:hypothetical protein
MEPQLDENHQWLMQLIGEWSYEGECPGPKEQPPIKLQGRESVRALGGLWVLAESVGDTPEGGKTQTLMTLGYDHQLLRFTGTFIASMLASLWVYSGELDAARNVLALSTEGPDMSAPGKTAQYRDEIEIVSADQRTLHSSILGGDGQWQTFMTIRYQRI